MLAGVDFSQERYKKISSILPKLKEIMEQEGRTIIQGQLGYLMTTSETTIPLLGTKRLNKLKRMLKP